ncbi:MAG: hypothetical protein MUE72_10670 [Chitinophagaceae bacterium]|jgi:hypothetical protein|nr:hypothetical protein [Chitinophagaceae bacterium]
MLNPVSNIGESLFYLLILFTAYVIAFIRAIVIYKIHGLQAVLTITLLALLTFYILHFLNKLEDENIFLTCIIFTLIIIIIPLKLIPTKVISISFIITLFIICYFEFSFKKKLSNYLFAQSLISYETISLYTWAEKNDNDIAWEMIYKKYPDPKVIVEGLNCYFYSTVNTLDNKIYNNQAFRNATFLAWSVHTKNRKEKIGFETEEYSNTSYYIFNGNGDAALHVSLMEEFMFWWIALAEKDIIMQLHIEEFFKAIEKECLYPIFPEHYNLENLIASYSKYIERIKSFHNAEKIRLSLKQAMAHATAKELADKAAKEDEILYEENGEETE